MAKPVIDSEIFIDQLIVQIRIHLQSVGGVFITAGTIAPSPLPIPGFKTWIGYTIPPSGAVNPNPVAGSEGGVDGTTTQTGLQGFVGDDVAELVFDAEFDRDFLVEGDVLVPRRTPTPTPTPTPTENTTPDSSENTTPESSGINLSGLTEENFYTKFLENIGAPVTDENLKFVYGWRQAEGKSGEFNPFNTTQPWPNSTRFSNMGNGIGVRNYATIEDGMAATVKTITNGYYDCILNGLRNNIGAIETSKCPSLKTWGTGTLLFRVLESGGGDVSIIKRRPLVGLIRVIK
jgi:hypothetical protein